MTMLVATHKSADVPSDGFHLPVHVGHALNPIDLGYQSDDEGENISDLNGTYCELTGLYWAWRNLDSELLGLSHYRRYFRGTSVGPKASRIMSKSDAERLLDRYDFVVGRRRHYFVETVESHYRHAHHGDDLDVLRDVVGEVAPDSVSAYESVLSGRSLSLYNMFLTRRELFDSYAEWLFPILEETRHRLDGGPARTAYQNRTLGYLGERLLNVWVKSRDDLKIGHVPVVNVDGEPKVRKGTKLLARKLGLIDPATRNA